MAKPNINTSTYWDSVYELEIKKGLIRFVTKQAQEILELIKEKDNVLDYGCGTGSLSRFIKDNRPNIFIAGFDISRVAISYCISQKKQVLYTTHCDFEPNFFDAIILSHVIEHTDYPNELIDEVRGMLKPNGLLILSIPLNDNEWIEHQKIWHLNDIEELLRPYDCDYTVKVLTLDLLYPDGRKFVEVLVAVRFNG